MKQIQIKLNVLFHKAKLEVRFPCSLVAILQIEKEEIHWNREVPLKNKLCTIQQQISHTFFAFYQTQKALFIQKKISILLFLKSSSGKITAGSSNFNLNQLKPGINNLTIPIQKCPDKNAFIQLSVNYQNISQMDVVQTETHIFSPDNLQNFSSQQLDTHRKKHIRQRQLSQRSNGQKEKEKEVLTVYKSNAQFETYNDVIKRAMRSNDRASCSKQKREKDNEILNQVKHLRLQLQNQELKQSKHKPQPHNATFLHQTYTLKVKNSQLQRQVKNLQKKIDHMLLQNRSITNQRDMLEKRSKELQFQFKTFKQKYEDINESRDNTVKKNEFKENYYKDQIKSLSDKLNLSQSEKQRMIFEKNDIINDFQERQKLLRLGIKDREKGSIDQRAKLIKKIEQLTKQIEEQQLLKNQAESKVESINVILNAQIRNQKQIAQTNQELEREIERLKATIKDYKDKIVQMEQSNVGKLQFEEEKKKMKKKLNQAEQENVNLSKNAVVLETNMQKLSKRIEDLQLSQKEKNNEYKILLRQQENKQKQIENLKRIIEQKQKKAEQSFQKKQKQLQKLSNTIEQSKKRQQKLAFDLKNARHQLKQKDNKLKKFQSEIEDHTDLIETNNHQIKSLQIQLNDLKLIFTKKKIQLDQFSVQNARLHSEVKQYKQNIQNVSKELKEKQSALKTQLNAKNLQLNSLKEVLSKLQLRSRDNEQELSYKISKLQVQIADKTQLNKDLLENIRILNENIYELQQQKSKKGQSVQELLYKLKLNATQISFLKKSNENNNEQISQANIINKQLKNQIQKLKNKIVELNTQISQLQSDIQQLTLNSNSNQDEFNIYKQTNKKHLLTFLNIITGQGHIYFQPNHQQDEIKLAMKQAIKNINNYFISKDKQIAQINSDLNEQVAKTNHLIQDLDVSRQNYDQLTGEYNDLINQLNHLNQNSEYKVNELKGQNEGLNTQIQGLQEEVKKTKILLEKKQKECQNLKGQITKKNKQIQTSLGVNSKLKDDIKRLEQSSSGSNSKLKEDIKKLEQNLSKKQKECQNLKQQVIKKNHQIQASLGVNTKQKEELRNHEQNIVKLNNHIKQNKLKQEQFKRNIKQLTQKSKNSSKQQKQYEKQTAKKIFELEGENSRKGHEIERLLKQIQKKNENLLSSHEISNKLKGDLEQSRSAYDKLLKENEKVNHKNQESTFYTNSLEQQINNLKIYQKSLLVKIAQLEKAIKDKSIQLTSVKDEIAKHIKEIQKNVQEIQRSNEKTKGQQQTIKRQLLQLTKIQEQFKKANTKLQLNEKQSGDLVSKLKKQVEILTQQKVKKQKQFNGHKQRYEFSLNQEQRVRAQLQRQNQQMRLINKQLDGQVIELTKSITENQRKNHLQQNYMKSIKDNVQMLKGHLTEYSKVGDQFQANKNKLIKLSTVKMEQYTQKNIFDRVKDVSSAYNKLKLFMLTNKGMNEQMKLDLTEEMKKVQAPLDRILRGDK